MDTIKNICKGGRRDGRIFEANPQSNEIFDRDKNGEIYGHYVKTNQHIPLPTGIFNVWKFQEN